MRRLVANLWILACVAAVLIPALATAQAQPPAPAAATGQFRIAGILSNAATGEPVRRALVQAMDATGHTAGTSTTDADGHFLLPHLPAAKYQLTASKRGFRTASYDEHDEFATSIVTGPDQDTTHLDYKLMPNAVLHGVVTSDDGEPVAGASVMLFKRSKRDGQKIERAGGAQTDDTGEYEIGDLASGEYMLAVSAEPWYAVHSGAAAKKNSALDVVYPVTFFDSTTDERAATPIELAGGMRQEINISMHAVPSLHISIPAPERADGSVVVPQLQRIAFGTVIDTQSSGDFFGGAQGRTLELGGVAPGRYELAMGEPQRVMDVDLSANQQIDADAGAAASAVKGVVRMIAGSALPEEMTLTLNRLDGGAGQAQFATEARAGRFTFMPVPPGDYEVLATAGDKALPVVATAVGLKQQAGNTLTLREGGPALTITVSAADTRIDGFAKKDGKGIAGVMMVLLPRDPAQWKSLTRRDQSDSDGSFAFRDVAPGAYTAVAIQDGWPLDWASYPVMQRYLRAGTNVTVSGNSGKVIKLPAPVAVQQR
ncbi:carboxypeptidase regulatory-like domain-containing protein [Occallatibacter savannae]|uniref:carboxypeptidase regulatory-like domain-containing protein n=1 Tax=Occallatibacter savannae TaxID=1002691 RepID=UPI000D68687A|nr:carboxypeptidase regulatory-like domain-containing protein [Occallatibacter savannae]